MLALGLTTVILLAISMAIDLHLRSFDSRRKRLEESQLARAILTIISDDIRCVVMEYQQDVSAVETLVQETAQSAISAVTGGAGGNQGGGEQGGSGASSEDSGGTIDTGSEEMTSAATQDLANALTLPTKPGIYGNQYQLQLDISRLPRFDEYQAMLVPDPTSTLRDIPSDVKTVTYYVLSPQAALPNAAANVALEDPTASTNPDVVGRGLVRRQLDRAVTQWAMSNGVFTQDGSLGEVIAPEVVSIEFQYFDGLEWRLEWDTELEGALPVAIQIVLLMESPTGAAVSQDQPVARTPELDLTNLRYYRLLVPVATGQEAQTEDTSLEAAGL